MYKNLVSSFDCEQGAVRAVRYTHNGDYCITSGSNKSVRLWNPDKKLLLQQYVGHNGEVLDSRGSPDSSFICSGGIDRYVYLWDVLTGRSVRYYREHMGPVHSVQFNQDGSILVSGSFDGSVRIFDLRSHSRESIQVLKEAKDSVSAVFCNAQQVLSASLDGRVRIYDLRRGLLEEDHCGAAVLSLAETKDGQCILVSCMDSCVRLLDKQNGQILAEYRGHVASKYRLDCGFNQDDSVVLCASEDGKVHFWSLLDANVLGQAIHEGKRVVHSLTTSEHKGQLLTAAEERVYIWSGEEIAG